VYFREGEIAGALAQLSGEAEHAFSVEAATRAELVFLPEAAVGQLVVASADIRTVLTEGLETEKAARAVETQSYPSPAPKRTHAMPLSAGALFEAGLAQGREILAVDQTLCTYCNSCVDACARRHGESRLELRGLQLDHLLFPTACRHCEDPVCLLCSVSGIVRRPSGEISIVEENCIGCGACAERCPYGNIRMHPVEAESKNTWDKLQEFFFGRRRHLDLYDESHKDMAKKAVKCDLCADYRDYACVSACPTGAAFRADVSAALGREAGLIGLEMRGKESSE
jgi:Fe-S-cluster-containing hydrogenase component 2